MFTRILSAFTWPVRKLIGLERQGRVVCSLILVDAAGLGLWLFALNGYAFHRPLDQDDYSTMMVVPPLCYAACLLYGLRPGRLSWLWVVKVLLGQALAAAILYRVFASLDMDLSGRQALQFLASYLPLLLLTRLGYILCRRILPGAPLECLRIALAAGAGLFLFGGRFMTSGRVGSGDSYWYSIMVGDFVTQWRAGAFPALVGQSEYAFNGAVNLFRFAPGLQHLAGLVDLFTGQSLQFYTLQNLTLTICGFACVFSAYFCVVAILPKRRWMALALAVLYPACPGVLSFGYQDLLMSVAALPFVPLALYGLWRTLQADGRVSIAWTVLPLAAAWYCHPPIAFCLTFVAVVAHLAIGLRQWRDPGLYAWWTWGAVLFILATGYLFVSVATLRLPSTGSNIDGMIDNIRDAFPAMLLPVSAGANAPGDYQLGWALWGALLLSAAFCCFRRRRSEMVMLLASGAILLLLLPVPWLNKTLWRALPAQVWDIVQVPVERFYVILAGLAIIAAAGTLARLGRLRPVWTAVAILLFSAGGVWSFCEAAKFALHDYIRRGGAASAPGPDYDLDLNNIILTRYSFNPFPDVPPYFSHGYVDPYLENRVLASDGTTVLASNVAAARPPDTAKQIPLTAAYDGHRIADLSPEFVIAPGVRYAVRFVPSTHPDPGSLLALGQFVHREYFMPDSGMGMPRLVPGDDFGFTATSRDFFPIWTARTEPEKISMQYVYDKPPSQPVPEKFARLYLRAYTTENLPVSVYSWIPYRAKVTTAAAGALLETPRMFVQGYAATVNGHPSEVSQTASGLVAVRLATGSNDVVLSYRGPWVLRAAYWTALFTWVGVICALIGAASGRIRKIRRPANQILETIP